MKKLILLLLIALPFIVNAQEDRITYTRQITGVTNSPQNTASVNEDIRKGNALTDTTKQLRASVDVNKINITLNDAELLIHSTMLQDSLGWFNVVSYGAISNDGLEDQTAINVACTVASVSKTHGNGGTVYIPKGQWYITAPVKILDDVHIEVDEGAKFNFSEFYSGAMYQLDSVDLSSPDRDGHVANASITGGQYGTWGRNATWTFLNILANDLDSSRMYSCRFENMWVEEPAIGININISNDGWVHGNTFRNITIQRPVIGIKSRGGSAGIGLEDNMFENIFIQTQEDSTIICIDSLEQGRGNIFNNVRLYDLAGATVAGGFESDFDGTTIVGGNFTSSTGWYDDGDGNNYVSQNRSNTKAVTVIAADGIDTDDWFDQYNWDQHFVIMATPASAVDITADPQLEIAGVRSGQFLTIIGTSNTNTLKLDNANSLRLIGGKSVILGDIDNITFEYSSHHGYWLEVGRMDFGGLVQYDPIFQERVIIDNTLNYAADAQADDDYEISITGITTLRAGLEVTFTANTANTGGATLEITSVGDLDAILKQHDAALVTGDIEAGQVVVCVWDGNSWQMTSQLAQ